MGWDQRSPTRHRCQCSQRGCRAVIGAVGRWLHGRILAFGGLCTAGIWSVLRALAVVVHPFVAFAASDVRCHRCVVGASASLVSAHPRFPQIGRRQSTVAAMVSSADPADVHGWRVGIALRTHGAAHLKPPSKSAHPAVLYLLHWRFHRRFSDHRWMSLFHSFSFRSEVSEPLL